MRAEQTWSTHGALIPARYELVHGLGVLLHRFLLGHFAQVAPRCPAGAASWQSSICLVLLYYIEAKGSNAKEEGTISLYLQN
jgi:hypothetical protein